MVYRAATPSSRSRGQARANPGHRDLTTTFSRHAKTPKQLGLTFRSMTPMQSNMNNNMNHTDGWMGGWSGGGMWVLTVIGVAVVVLLVVIIINQSKKK